MTNEIDTWKGALNRALAQTVHNEIRQKAKRSRAETEALLEKLCIPEMPPLDLNNIEFFDAEDAANRGQCRIVDTSTPQKMAQFINENGMYEEFLQDQICFSLCTKQFLKEVGEELARMNAPTDSVAEEEE